METLQGMKDAVLVWKYLQIMHKSIICVLSCPIAIFIANLGYSIKSKKIQKVQLCKITLKLNISFDLSQTVVGETGICSKVLGPDIVDPELHPLGVAVLADLVHLEPATVVDGVVLAPTLIYFHPVVD